MRRLMQYAVALGAWTAGTCLLPAGILDARLARVPAGTVVNLTEEGTLDWVHWGLYTETSVNRKAGVTPRISNFELIWNFQNSNAWAFVWQFGDHYNGYSWSDGTPTPQVTDTTTGVWAYGVPTIGSGFALTVPADATLKTVKIYVGVYGGGGQLTARLSDDSARAYQNTQLFNRGNGEGGVYTIDFAADSPGQTLEITWTLQLLNDSQANVTLQAAALSAAGVNNPPSVLLTAPGQNDQFPVGADISLVAQASDLDGTVSLVEFFSGDAKVGEAASEPFAVTWSDAPPGWHVLTARATDDQGGAMASAPVEVFVHANGGYLLGGVDAGPSEHVDLTLEGTVDWGHWGLQSTNSFNHKTAVSPEMSGMVPLGEDPLRRYTNNFSAYAWSDGMPVSEEPGTTTGLFQTGLDGGFEVSIPVGITAKRVQVYAGLYGGASQFQAYLSDYSAAAFTDTSLSNVYGNSCVLYTMDVQAAQPNQNLILRYRAHRLFDLIYGNMTWQAVAVSTGGTTPPSPALLINPIWSNGQFGFQFDTEVGRTYAVQSADRLVVGWQTWTNLDGTGEVVSVRDERPASASRFYRVETQ